MNLKQLKNPGKDFSIRWLNASPVGPMLFAASTDGLMVSSIMTDDDKTFFKERTADPVSGRIVEAAVSEMNEYFNRKLKNFTVAVDLKDLTDFQRRVLLETKAIPFGSVCTYGEMARRIERPRAARAVGGALARNPIGIIIPCHRVVAHDRRLHGFSSPQGILTKALLLENEGVLITHGAAKSGSI